MNGTGRQGQDRVKSPEKRTILGMGNRLVLWFVLFALLPLGLTVLAGHMLLKAQTEDQTERLMRSLAASMKHDVEHYFEDMSMAFQALSGRRITRAMMDSVDSEKAGERSSSHEIYGTPEDIRDEFEITVLPQHLKPESYRDLFMIDTRGVVTYSKNGGLAKGSDLFGKTYYDTLFSGALKTAMNTDRVVFSDYEYAPQGGENVPVAHMVKNLSGVNGETIGLLAVRFDVEGLNRVVGVHADLGQTFDLYLCGIDGRLRTDKGKRTVKKALTPWDLAVGKTREVWGKEDLHSGLNRQATEDGTTMFWVSSPLTVLGVPFMIVAEMEGKDVYAMKDKVWAALFFLAAILAVVMAGLAVALAGKITQPVSALGDWAEKVAMGDLALVEIDCPDDEMGQFVRNFRRVVEFLKETARLAMDLAAGDYTTDIELRSANDELGHSLKRMTESLKDAARAMQALASGDFHAQVAVKGPSDLFALSLNGMVDRLRETHEQGRIQARQKTLQADLNEILRGDKTLDDLSRHVLSFFCLCFKASVGAFYVRDGKDDRLKLYSGFALSAHRTPPLSIDPGEGLVGQVMREKRKIVFSDCPGYFLDAQALVAEIRLASVMAFPFVREGRVEGVVELAVHGRFSEKDLDFLDLVSESVAIALFSAVSRLRMKELLDKTVKQADDLRQKQQELNLINKDLKEQAEKLQKSERQLMAKEEELIRINTALEERSYYLEQQKDAVREKNLELEKIQAELIEKTRSLESVSRHKSEFLANMSHELRTPLNSILLISRLLSENRQGNLVKRQIEFAQTIHMAGLDLLNLIDDILDLSRIEAGRLELLPVQARLADIERRIRLNFSDICREKGIDLVTDIRANTPDALFVDLKRLDQVLKNLVSNAVKFTVSGHVKIVFSVPEHFPPELQIQGEPAKSLMVKVEDTGTGIPEDRHDAVFEAFCQADRSIGKKYGGTGLGLSISRELVRLMGGGILLHSEVDVGSTFVFIIPNVFGDNGEENVLESQDTAVAPPLVEKGQEDVELAAAHRELAGSKILIVDMDMRNVYALIHCFENDQLTILVARNGDQGLEILEREGDVDLVIMDLLMPGMGGVEAMEFIRRHDRFKDTPVIALTARAMKGDREKCLAAGANAYLSKPVALDRLMDIMKDLLRRNRENEIKKNADGADA